MSNRLDALPADVGKLEELRRRWDRIGEDLESPMIELTPEEFAVVLFHFKLLRHAGHRFDRVTVALFNILEAQMSGCDDDSDSENDLTFDGYSEDHGVEEMPFRSCAAMAAPFAESVYSEKGGRYGTGAL